MVDVTRFPRKYQTATAVALAQALLTKGPKACTMTQWSMGERLHIWPTPKAIDLR